MKTSRHIIYMIIKYMIAGTFLFGCSKFGSTPSPDFTDKSPFTGVPCAAPCWQGLIVGKSIENDVEKTVPTLTFIDQSSVYYHRMPTMSTLDPEVFGEGVEITANCADSAKQCLTIQVVENILTEISLELNYHIKVDEAIDYLGNPDLIGYGTLGAERIICEVYLIWSDKQLVLASEEFEGFKATEDNCGVVRDTGKVASSLLISEARYLSVEGIDFMISRSYNQTFEFTGMTVDK